MPVEPSRLAAAINAPNTGEAFPVLVTIAHRLLAQPLRVARNHVDLKSRGAVFIAYPFEVILPDAGPDRRARSRVRIDNVHEEILETLRALKGKGRARLKIEIVLGSALDEPIYETPWLDLRDVGYDDLYVESELLRRSYSGEPYPGRRFTPGDWPALFAKTWQ